MATKELAVKFTEIGLGDLARKVEQTVGRISPKLDEIVRKVKKTAEETQKALQTAVAGGSTDTAELEKKLVGEAVKLGRAVESAFKQLRVSSEREFRLIKDTATRSFTAITESGTASAREVARAQAGLAAKFREVAAQSDAIPAAITAAFKNLKTESSAAVTAMKRSLVADFVAIKASGVATPAEIAQAWRNLKGEIKAVNNREVVSAFKSMGVQSQAAINELKQSALEDFKAIRFGAKSTANDIERAYRALKDRLHDLNAAQTPLAPRFAPTPAVDTVGESFKSLGVESQAAIEALKQKAINDFKVIRADGKSTANDIARAFISLREKLAALNLKQTVVAGTPQADNEAAVTQAFKNLGIRSADAIQELKQKAVADFKTIRVEAGKVTADVERAFRALKGNLRALNLEITGKQQAKAAIDEVEQAFKRLGATSESAINKLKQQAVADFELIKNSGKNSAEEIARAYEAMQAKIADADRLRTGAPQPKQAKSEPTPFQTLNIKSLADFRAEQQRIIEAYHTIRNDAGKSAVDVNNAHKAMTSSLKDLNREFLSQSGLLNEQEGRWRKLLFTLSGTAFAISGIAFAFTGLALAISKPFREIGELEGRFEKFEATLRSLGDTADRAKQSTAFIKDLVFSTKTVFSLDAVTDAFVKMKAVGIDPTKGALESLTNAIAATGGNEEKLNRAAFAIQQIASKGRAYSEEVIQQLSEQLPGTVQIVARAFGFAADETGKLLEQMKKRGIGARDFLSALFSQLKKEFGSASKEFLNTFPGILQQFKNQYQRFVDETAESGAFEGLKTALKEVQAEISAAFADGRAQQFAKDLSDALVGVINVTKTVVKFFKDWGAEIVSILKFTAGFLILRGVISGVISLFIGFTAARVAIAALPAAIAAVTGAVAGGEGLIVALTRLRTLIIAASGPVGWIAAIAFALYEAAKGANEFKNKIDEARVANENFKRGSATSPDAETTDKVRDGINALKGQIKELEDGNERAKKVLEARPKQDRDSFRETMEARIASRQKTIDAYKKQLADLEKTVNPPKTSIRAPSNKVDEVGGLEGVPNATGSSGEADRVNAARREKILAGFRDEIELAREQAKNLKDIEDSNFKERLVGINEHWDNVIKIERDALTKEKEILGREVAFLKKSKGKDEPERLEIQKQLNNALNEQGKIDVKLSGLQKKYAGDRAKDWQEFQERLKKVDQDIQQASGNRRAAEFERIKREYDTLREDIQRNYKSKPLELEFHLSQANKSEALAKARAEVEGIEHTLQRAQQIRDVSADKAQLGQETGTSTRLEALQALSEANKEYLKTLETESAKIQAQIDGLKAQGLATDELTLKLGRYHVEMLRVRTATDLVSKTIKDDLLGSFKGFFDRVIDGTERIGQSWKHLLGDIKSMFLKLIAEDLISKLFRTGTDGKGNPTGGVLDSVTGLLGKVIIGPQEKKSSSTTAATTAEAKKEETGGLFDGIFDLLNEGFGGIFGKLGGVLKSLFGTFGKDLVSLAKEGFSFLQGVFGFAEGGLFRGEGTGTSDSNIIAVSDHEYIMPAKETKKWLPILETMRAGKFGDWLSGIAGITSSIKIPKTARFAEGGLVSGQSLAPQVINLQTKTPATQVNLRLEPNMINMTLRDWLEGEIGRIAATR